MTGLARATIVAACMALMLVGCSSAPKKETPADTQASTGAGAGAVPPPPDTTTSPMAGAGQMKGDPLNDPNSLLAKRVVYFDFDSAVVRDDFTAILEAHAGYLADHPNVVVTLEGHCDERGTREYNLGLGERRAQAVQQFLSLMGARATQMKTVSYGEERPATDGHSEDAWRLNRRVELVYK